jgi:serine protease Do
MTMNRARWALAVGGLCVGVAIGAFLAGPSSHGEPAAASRELTSYRDVVRRVLPAVVSIEAKARPQPAAPRRKTRPANFDRLPREMQQYIEEMERREQAAPDDGNLGFGSGFLIDPKGVIVTNFHVVEGAETLEVTLTDGRKFTTRDYVTDRKTDLAVVRVATTEDLPVVEFGDSDAMEMGDRVLAFGSPFGLTGTVTQGIVSAKGRAIKLNFYEDFIQTDAALNPGSSGGPLVGLDGKVIGVTAAIKSRNGGFQGVGLAIAANMARTVIRLLARDGAVKRGYLGVKIDELKPEDAARLGLNNMGVVVKKIFPNSPASDGGLKVGDVITAINGRPVKDGLELSKIVEWLPPNAAAELTIFRDGKAMKLTLTITEQPETVG